MGEVTVKVGDTYGKLTVLRRDSVISKYVWWVCRCECGGEKSVTTSHLTRGGVKSCGCLGKKAGRHAVERTRTYTTWQSMWARCTNPNSTSYPKYGARGITVCERWRTFSVFLQDMGERPEGCSLDRIDGARGYSPENCRWSTSQEQNRNRVGVIRVSFRGEDVLFCALVARLGIDRGVLYQRWVSAGRPSDITDLVDTYLHNRGA